VGAQPLYCSPPPHTGRRPEKKPLLQRGAPFWEGDSNKRLLEDGLLKTPQPQENLRPQLPEPSSKLKVISPRKLSPHLKNKPFPTNGNFKNHLKNKTQKDFLIPQTPFFKK